MRIANLDYSTAYQRLKTKALLLTEEGIKKLFLTPNTAWTSTSCSSISIRSRTFTNFNYMKTVQSSMSDISYVSKMRMQGIILNLAEFYGDILIKDNTFTHKNSSLNTEEL